jgi:nucleotide-binding universal stress UspA family protein
LEMTAKRYGIPLRAEHIHVKEGRPFEEICRLALKIDIDLIIIPTRGNTGLKHLALGSTAERVVRYSPCPVLVLRSKAGGNGKLPAASITFRKILVPIDFSDCSMKGVAYARTLARQFHSKLILLNSVAIQYWITNDEYTRYDLPLLTQQSEKIAREQMRDLVQKLQKEELEVSSAVEIGHAGQQICAAAEQDRIDLIVTSTHGTTGLKHVLLGSTAEYVVRHATRPVLIVPNHERPVLPSTAKTE